MEKSENETKNVNIIKKNIENVLDVELSTSPNIYRENCLTRNYEKNSRNIYCGNCGNLGHTYRRCRYPITSCGVILYKKNIEYVENKDKINKYYFLLIQRKDTLGYVEFLRGKYDEENKEYIKKLISTMTIDEISKIKNYDFEELWNLLWMNKNIKQYQTEFDNSKNKFLNLINGKYFNFQDLINEANVKYVEKEWGFPKGRRNIKETDFDCALREFEEETGLNNNDYEILRNINPVEEIFYGSNNIKYKHIYYIAKSNNDKDIFMDPLNKHQRIEISNIKWFTLNESLQKIRPYNTEKKDVIIKVNKLLINNNC
jgi:8-oxo-dGTP pyrophosphatase MutT (NUDIX family)